MTLFFLTGNKNKLDEVRRIIPEIKQKDIDLPEIQEIDAHKIIKEKLIQALKSSATGDEFVVEDTSLYLDCLNGLPGPLIKWFLTTIKNEGLYEICKRFDNYNAEAKTLVGYSKGSEIKFFEGTAKGKITRPEIPTSFGWDSIFIPDGFEKTFAEMSREEKNKISMRGLAFMKLREYLDSK
jgi:inosine triphosphate pyrophosphatase